MADPLNLSLGAPGIYRYPEARLRELGGVRMDVCAFVGVAPRGPARERVLDPVNRNGQPDPRVVRTLRRTVPVAVESFDDYRRWFGGFAGPGLLPYAVAAFFENGGRRAYVARIVHQYATDADNAGRTSWGVLGGARASTGPLAVRARNEGEWGDQLQATLAFNHAPLRVTSFMLSKVRVPEGEPLETGTMLRLTLANGERLYRAVTVLIKEPGGPTEPGSWVATLEQPMPALPVEAEVVETDLTIEDQEDASRTEHHTGLGLSSDHARWLWAALAYDSQLVFPDMSWRDATIHPDALEPGTPFLGGKDDYAAIIPDDFFDTTWTPEDDEPGDGVTSLVDLPDLSLLVAPDLYSPGPLAPRSEADEPVRGARPYFVRCEAQVAVADAPATVDVDLAGLRLDPATDLEEIGRWQSALADFAAQQRSFIVLLDVPPRLSPRQIETWRGRFNTAYAAAYHPWLKVARVDDDREVLIEQPPSAVAAGIIAQREIVDGIAHGPANLLAADVVDVSEVVPGRVHDELHPLGINVYLRERDGVRLTAARTLSREPAWRQLSVRRLLTMIRRALEQQMQWAVFEPNDGRLRAEVRRMVTTFLRRLLRAGAFRGATEEESFFVRCDEGLNPRQVVDAGQLITHIGVAPSEPLEFIVLRLMRDGDGTLTLED